MSFNRRLYLCWTRGVRRGAPFEYDFYSRYAFVQIDILGPFVGFCCGTSFRARNPVKLHGEKQKEMGSTYRWLRWGSRTLNRSAPIGFTAVIDIYGGLPLFHTARFDHIDLVSRPSTERHTPWVSRQRLEEGLWDSGG